MCIERTSEEDNGGALTNHPRVRHYLLCARYTKCDGRPNPLPGNRETKMRRDTTQFIVLRWNSISVAHAISR